MVSIFPGGTRMTLSDPQIRSAKPQDKSYSLVDSNGLRLLVNPNGSRLWKVRYFFDKREQTLSLGAYPNHRYCYPLK
ncbi:Arm DNA-binding domain-containing protein [Asticcacaulis sp.]|uniref:Arm DNA-binding domain-containing protein n=1 Tax=Asticcacaulis sp. TaxID=1872648 RepID=UPI003F7C7488